MVASSLLILALMALSLCRVSTAQSTRYEFIEQRSYPSHPSCGQGATPLRGMISGTKSNKCRYIGGSYVLSTCDAWLASGDDVQASHDGERAVPHVLVRTFDASDATCSSTPARLSHSFPHGCKPTSEKTSVREACVSSEAPFASYGPGLFIALSESLASCQGEVTDADSWTFVPIGQCFRVDNLVAGGKGSQMITSCSQAEVDAKGEAIASYQVNYYDDIKCETEITKTDTHTLDACSRDMDGKFKRHFCHAN